MQRNLWVFLLLFSLVNAMARPPITCPIPMEKGTRWTYEAKMEWTDADSGVVRSTNIEWVMEVLNVRQKDGVRAAVIRGFPPDLSWYDPKQSPGFTILIAATNRVFWLEPETEADANMFAQQFVTTPSKITNFANEWLVLPFAKNKSWGGETNREDNWYCWHVEDQKRKSVEVAGYPGNQPAFVWTLAFRTNPDHQIFDLVDGLGITRYAYEHHGTVASADLRLVSFVKGDANVVLPRSERTNLLEYVDKHGNMEPVKSKADWLKRRAEILEGMQQVMGPLPGKEKRCALDVKILEEVDCGSYVRQKLTYASEPGSRVPAYLLIPKAASKKNKLPAVLCLHPTHQLGNQSIVGVGKTSYPGYGVELAERGYVVLAPAYPILADYRPDLKALGYQSGTMKAIWDNMRGLDLLESLPFVKKGGFGAIGHSLGGHNSIYTAVFDPRIKVIVSSCGFDSFRDYKHGDITGWTSDRYMPKLKNYRSDEVPFDFHELIGALAPRVCFVNAPLKDDNFQYWSVDEVVRSAQQLYQLYGMPGGLQVVHPDCLHDFPPYVREQAYRILDQHLR